jgi:hypothetical protein
MTPAPADLAAFIIAVCFAAGLNVYATTATLGLLGRFGFVALPDQISLLTDWWVIGGASALFAAEFIADKVPIVDLIWNVFQTIVRVPAAGLLAYAAASPLPFGWQLVAAALGASIAAAAHSGKVAARSAVTASPEPVSNIGLSLFEDALAIGLTWFATQHPYLAATIVLTLVAIVVLFLRWLILAFRRRRRNVPEPHGIVR